MNGYEPAVSNCWQAQNKTPRTEQGIRAEKWSELERQQRGDDGSACMCVLFISIISFKPLEKIIPF